MWGVRRTPGYRPEIDYTMPWLQWNILRSLHFVCRQSIISTPVQRSLKQLKSCYYKVSVNHITFTTTRSFQSHWPYHKVTSKGTPGQNRWPFHVKGHWRCDPYELPSHQETSNRLLHPRRWWCKWESGHTSKGYLTHKKVKFTSTTHSF